MGIEDTTNDAAGNLRATDVFGGGGGEGDSFLDTVPESYRDKPYMKEIDSIDKLFEQFDNSQKLIGKKTVGVPTAESSMEEWNEFYNKMGRPESPDKYEFESVEDFPEDMKRSETQEKALRQIFHEAGLTASQAKNVVKKLDAATKEMYEAQKADYEKMVNGKRAEFKQKVDKYFGSDSAKAVQVTEGLLNKYVPKGLEDAVKSLDDDSMLIMATVLNNMRSDALGEDSMFKNDDITPTQTAEDLRAKAKELMLKPEFRDAMHPNHEKLRAEVQSIYQKIAGKG